jgi:hypothetical protein
MPTYRDGVTEEEVRRRVFVLLSVFVSSCVLLVA